MPPGTAFEVLPAVDSTNAEALRRMAAGELGPLWLLGLAQSSGRGRRGRAWAMQPGNFAATLVMPVAGPAAQTALRSFIAALALRDAIVALTGRADLVALKWPNDVLLAEGKLAGILLETGGVPGGPGVVAVGFGVNLVAVPEPGNVEPGAVRPVSLRGETGFTVEPERFLEALAAAFAHWEGVFGRDGFGPVRSAWLGSAARLGARIVARLPGREIAGRFETIDETGALILATATGRIALAAAEIHFGPADAHASCD